MTFYRNSVVMIWTVLVMAKSVMAQDATNFTLNNGAVYWQKVYEANGDGLLPALKLNRYVEVVGESPDLILDIADYVFEKNGYTCSGRAVVEMKDGKYRVTVRDISYKPGASANAMATAMLGGNPDFEFQANEAFVKRGSLHTKNKIMKAMDEGLTRLFAEVEKKEDW